VTQEKAVDARYTMRDIEAMLGLSRSVIVHLIDAGFVLPERGARNEYRFSFQDVVLLRTAHGLRAADIPARRLVQSLKQLKARLPTQIPLSGLRIKAIGDAVAVKDGDAHWDAHSGQLLMDFEVATSGGSVSFLTRDEAADIDPREPRPDTADACFRRGESLETRDASEAEAAYRAAVALAPEHADASLNLGAMLCEGGRCAEALAIFDAAIERSPEAPLLHFNRAIALEDQQREREALASYERCLRLDPELADAHYNAARLHEKLNHAQAALRHYSAYRRLNA
jgi:tetratricopeptide (TPR) repeat protein